MGIVATDVRRLLIRLQRWKDLQPPYVGCYDAILDRSRLTRTNTCETVCAWVLMGRRFWCWEEASAA
jgi:hypothetical protein